MRFIVYRVGIAAMAAGLAGQSVPAATAPMRFDCDSMDGANSEIAQTQDGPSYRLRTQISPKRAGRHREWRANALILIRSADDKAYVGVRLAATAAKPPGFSVLLETVQDGEHKQFNVTTVKLGDTVNASIDIKDGSARVEVAGQVADLAIPIGKGAVISASCSTGQFMFEKLEMAPGI
jgi:hypothetical protein